MSNIQYVMIAFNTALSKHVTWSSVNFVDSQATLSGYPLSQLTNIRVDYQISVPDNVGIGPLSLLTGPSGPGFFHSTVAGGNITQGKATLIVDGYIQPFSLNLLPYAGGFGGVALNSNSIGLDGYVRTQGPDLTIPLLGDGYTCAVGCKSDGTLCRATDINCVSGLYYLGYCDIHGSVTVAPKRADYYNVLDYGLLNDGVTPNDGYFSDLSAIIASTTKSGIVYFPPGNYVFNNTIPAFPTGCVFRGNDSGIGASQLKFAGTGYFFNANSGQIFENLSFIGTKSSTMRPVVVSNASNASPIEITTNVAHSYNTGDLVNIFGVTGNTAVNNDVPNPWTITKIDSTHFTLNGSTGNGSYSNAGLTITNATNATPIVITTSTAHGYQSQQRINISGVTGNTAANGDWQIVVTSPTQFSLWQNSFLGVGPAIGNGNYISGGQSLAGGVALSNSNIPLIGLNLGVISGGGSVGEVTVRNCTFDSFKWQISVDGGELIYIEKCTFGGENGGLVLEMFSDYNTHSCFAIRIGSFDQTIPQDANVVFVDQCQFINTYRSMYHHDGITHTVSRSNFEQPVMSTISGFVENVIYDQCTNDGTSVDAIQLMSDHQVGTASYNLTIQGCFISGSKALLNINTGLYNTNAVSLIGLSVLNNMWLGANTLAKVFPFNAGPFVFSGNNCTNMGTNPLFDGFGATPNGQPGTTINHYQYPVASLDVLASDSVNFPAFRIHDTSSIYLDRKWQSTISIEPTIYTGNDNLVSYNSSAISLINGQKDQWVYFPPNGGSADGYGAVSIPIGGSGSVIARITATRNDGSNNASFWEYKQRYYNEGSVAFLTPQPEETTVDKFDAAFIDPVLTITGSTITVRLTAHPTQGSSWLVDLQAQQVTR